MAKAHLKPTPDSGVNCIPPPKRPRTPTRADQVAMLEFEIASLRHSFTILRGPDKGEIEDKSVLWEIRCLEAALDNIRQL